MYPENIEVFNYKKALIELSKLKIKAGL